MTIRAIPMSALCMAPSNQQLQKQTKLKKNNNLIQLKKHKARGCHKRKEKNRSSRERRKKRPRLGTTRIMFKLIRRIQILIFSFK